MSQESQLRGPLDKQHGKRSQALLKSASHQLYHIHWSLPKKLRLKNSLLLTCQILVLLVSTLAANGRYPVLNRDNLTIPIQMQLPKKQKTSSQFFSAFLNSISTFNYFKTKYGTHRFCICEITDHENVVK